MPIYEYHCEKCDNTFECLVLKDDRPCCPNCKEAQVKRVLSACGFVSKSAGGQTVGKSAGSSSCAGCAATSCSSCSH